MRKFDKIRHIKKKAFLKAYALAGGRIGKAAAAVGIDRTTHYVWMENDPEYVAAFEEIKDLAVTILEDEATRRAVDGTEKPVFYKGSECGTVQEYSDTLMMFLLKSLRPNKYRERATIEHSGPGGGPVTYREVIVERPAKVEDNDE